MSIRKSKVQAIEKRACTAIRVVDSAVDDASELASVLARDEAAWRRFVARYDKALRAVVRHATEPTGPLSDDEVDDVLGDFWLALVADDMRMLRAFNPSRGAALLTWLTFHVSHVAYEHLRRRGDEPTFVPLHEARNVPAPRAPSPRLRSEASSVDDAIRAAVRDAVASELRGVLGSRAAAAAPIPRGTSPSPRPPRSPTRIRRRSGHGSARDGFRRGARGGTTKCADLM